MKNIFMDFMSPDAWKTYLTIPKISKEWHTSFRNLLVTLMESINIAVLFTNQYCILPPAFILQSDLVFRAINKKNIFLKENLIRLPLRENSIDSYIGKKVSEYQYVKDTHTGFYMEDRWKFLYEHPYSIVKRNAIMGRSIADYWEDISDNSPVWKPIVSSLPYDADNLRIIPSLLNKDGISITLEAIIKKAKISPTVDSTFYINQAIQHKYIQQYLKEYDATILSNIPPKPSLVDYLIPIESVYYDYYFLKRVLQKLGAFRFITSAHEDVILSLRSDSNFIKFKDILYQLNSIIPEYAFLEVAKMIDYSHTQFSPLQSSIISWMVEKRMLRILQDRIRKVLDNGQISKEHSKIFNTNQPNKIGGNIYIC